MLDNIRVENVLFLDIETVPAYSKYSELPKPLQQLWDKKAISLSRYSQELWIGSAQDERKTPEELAERSGIDAYIAKIIGIKFG